MNFVTKIAIEFYFYKKIIQKNFVFESHSHPITGWIIFIVKPLILGVTILWIILIFKYGS